MFANFTAETATDTTGVLTLAGVTTGMIPFSASFADGDLVAYVAEDATNKVAGVGTYNSAGNTIARNDIWNFNGTVVDKNPSTNIVLSGSVTVRSDASTVTLFSSNGSLDDTATNNFYLPDNVIGHGSNDTSSPNRLQVKHVDFIRPVTISDFRTYIETADAASVNTRRGIYTAKDGSVGELLVDVLITTSSTGLKINSLPAPLSLPAGRYYFAFLTDSASLSVRHAGTSDHGFMYQRNIYDSNRSVAFVQSGVTGALPVSPVLSKTGSVGGTPVPAGFA